MASHPEVSVFSIDFANPDIYDSDVSRLFEAAADHPPGLIVLEDFDRVFAKKPESDEMNCSFNHILNCLDGLAGREGTIVVATANHPEHLDGAILRRPGRFDRVVHFPPPALEMRERYLRKLCPRLGEPAAAVAARAERMSFAQLREVWLLACQLACERGDDADGPDLERALAQVKREQGSAARAKLGFEMPRDENSGDFSATMATMKL